MQKGTLRKRLLALYDACAAEQAEMEGRFIARQRGPEELRALASALSHACHVQLEAIAGLAGDSADGWAAAREALSAHPLSQQYFSQAAIIAAARRGGGPPAAVFDQPGDQDQPPYAAALNQFFLARPALAAARAATDGIERILRSLPERSHVLAFDCGPALDLQRLASGGALGFSADLLDPGLGALTAAMAAISSRRAAFVRCDPVDLINGKTRFEKFQRKAHVSLSRAAYALPAGGCDLVYALSVMHRMRDFPAGSPRGASGLAARLFSLLKPGGRLIIGNYLLPGTRPHGLADQFIMDALLDWQPLYRTAEQIAAFHSAIPAAAFQASLLDETLAAPVTALSCIAHLVIERRAEG